MRVRASFKPAAAPDAPQAPAPIPLQMGSGLVLTVGAGMEFASLGDACKAAANGDTIAVQAGTYVNDFAVVNANIRIVSLGGMVNEVGTLPPPNDKGLLTVNANLSIQGFSFSGGSDGSPDGNVAGIRLQSGSLYVNYCYFHDMQEGLLADPNAAASVTINHSEFARNGTGDGYTHNLYVGAVGSLTIMNSYFHDANVGHEIKSRAAVTTIFNNVIADGPNGTASYDIDAPNAGVVRIFNNLIEKGPSAQNWFTIHYGGETQYAYANNSLSITGNTILNDLGANAYLLGNQSDQNGLNVSGIISGNQLYNFNQAQIAYGAATIGVNQVLASEPGYSTAGPWQAVPDQTLGTGPALLRLTNGAHTITGGNARLTVDDLGGNNSIVGGAGGLAAIAPGWDTITTAAGATDAITLTGRSNMLISAGADHIDALGYYQGVTATGPATITGSNFNSYNLDGAGERLTAGGGGLITVGQAGNAVVVDTRGDFPLTVAGGGHLAIADFSGTVYGASKTTAIVSGGGATGVIGDSGLVTLTTGDAGATVLAGLGNVIVNGGAGADTLWSGSGTNLFNLGGGTDRVSFAGGAATVNGGAGRDTYSFLCGQHGTVTINGFKPGQDVLQFGGFVGNPVASGSTANGSTSLVLTDGTQITFNGVSLGALNLPHAQISAADGGNETLGGAALFSLDQLALSAAGQLPAAEPAAAWQPDEQAIGHTAFLPDLHAPAWTDVCWMNDHMA